MKIATILPYKENYTVSKAQAAAKEKMSSVTGGMLSGLNLPGL